jgi:hypothetical protein
VAQPTPDLRAGLGAGHRWGSPRGGRLLPGGGVGDTRTGHISTSTAGRAARASTDRDAREQMAPNWPEMNLEEESDEEMELDMGEIDPHSIRWRYRNETWSHSNFTYDPKPIPFRGRRGPIKHYHSLPTFMHLFDLFWSYQTLRSIVKETNRYAT